MVLVRSVVTEKSFYTEEDCLIWILVSKRGVRWVMSEENTDYCATEVKSAGFKAVTLPIKCAAGGHRSGWMLVDSVINHCLGLYTRLQQTHTHKRDIGYV